MAKDIKALTGTDLADFTTLIRGLSLTPRGALVGLNADTSASVNYSAGAFIAWDREIYDTDTIHDNVTNNARLTVPTGVTWVRLSGCLNFQNTVTSTTGLYALFGKNGANTMFDGGAGIAFESGYGNPVLPFTSAPLSVTAGDYFQVAVFAIDTAVGIAKLGTWACMEILA